MDHAHLGRTGLKVSRRALGTMNFGELTDEAGSFAIMDEALAAGINFFDRGVCDELGEVPSDVTLSWETLKKLDAIWPGPGGEAPVADAW